MAMPENDTLWPPISENRIQDEYRHENAWYAGDETALSSLYMNETAGAIGLFGHVKRFFWGTPTPTDAKQRPVKFHLPLPAEIARMSGEQLFAEMPTIHIGDNTDDGSDQSTELGDTLTSLLDDSAHAELLQAGELASVFGGTYLRIQWDKSIDDKPFITAASPDHALPVFGLGGHLKSVTFWSDLPHISNVKADYRLLEDYTKGRIEYALYESNSPTMLGHRVPLDTHPVTKDLEVDEQSGIDTGSNMLTAVYVPNVKPKRRLRNDPAGMYLGRSDFEGAEGIFDALDEAYTSWMRDIRLGKARVFVNRQMLEQHGPGQGATFNADQEIFTPLNGQPGSALNQGKMLETFQPSIRWEEHKQTCQELVERAYSACGFSASTFGSAGDVAMTATEAQQRERLTMLTRSSKILYWRPQLRRLYAALLDVNNFVFNGPQRGDLMMPEVEFPPAATDSPNTVAQTLNLLNAAEVTSVRTRVQILHPDWDDEKVDTEVELIKSDLSMLPISDATNLYSAVADNGSTTGGVKIDQHGGYKTDEPQTGEGSKQ
ncbi:phage portal protein [Bifidobacterium sp. ESL0784]|uniref:phage portal protein n=1 Tax=Bifidobacterium sp. ESL0784 TaxID=2983231 RepID=UPI0023F67DD2|nr:phage portal protein [Bifidobacterium sp. ESL0784]MDF7641734.1 phage portal protein [Bifidobacterium sp. ESL0784]